MQVRILSASLIQSRERCWSKSSMMSVFQTEEAGALPVQRIPFISPGWQIIAPIL